MSTVVLFAGIAAVDDDDGGQTQCSRTADEAFIIYYHTSTPRGVRAMIHTSTPRGVRAMIAQQQQQQPRLLFIITGVRPANSSSTTVRPKDTKIRVPLLRNPIRQYPSSVSNTSVSNTSVSIVSIQYVTPIHRKGEDGRRYRSFVLLNNNHLRRRRRRWICRH